MQLELGFWPRGSVRAVLVEYLAMRSESITAETRELDYRVRMEWLCGVLGPATPAEDVTFSVLERVARASRLLLADVTIKKRFEFWAAAVSYASDREVTTAVRPKLPTWLQRHGRQMHDFYTPTQFAEFRMGLQPGRFRKFADLGFWTGQHTRDLESMERWMLEPDHTFEDAEQRGRWWRRNHKNKKCVGTWIPMEPEFRELAAEWLAEIGAPSKRLVGVVHNKKRHFERAAERAELPRVRANLGLRSSHASELLARGYSYEYVRLVLGHQGEIRAVERSVGGPEGTPPPGGPRAHTTRPSVLSAHYLRPSPETLRPQR